MPHFAETSHACVEHVGSSPSVVFVGSRRMYKGIHILREAVGRLRRDGYTLTVTDAPPPDAQPWERWVGRTTFAEGQSIVANGDIVALPSLPNSMADLQLPMKLCQAMGYGRAVIGSRLAPIEWALGDAGILISPGSVEALVDAMLELSSPARRSELGMRARLRAEQLFSPRAVARSFELACNGVTQASREAREGRSG